MGRTGKTENMHMTYEAENFVKQYAFFNKLSFITIAGSPKVDK